MPSSKLPERIAVDANSALSAVINGKANRVFKESGIREFATTAFTIQEVRNLIPALAAKLGLDAERLEAALQVLPVTIYPPSFYQHRMEEARRRMEDPDDVELLALALELEVPVWTKDEDFQGTGVACFRTGRLLKLMEERRPPQPPAP